MKCERRLVSYVLFAHELVEVEYRNKNMSEGSGGTAKCLATAAPALKKVARGGGGGGGRRHIFSKKL